MAKQARAYATREAIIRAAGVVFARQSYSTATLADVISEAGVTQGALYFHFDSKHDLATELIKRQHALSFAGDGNPTDPSTARGIEALVIMSGHLAHQIISDPVVQGGLRLSTESSELFPDYASRPYLDWIEACRIFVEQAMGDGDIDPSADAGSVARFIMSAFTGVQVVSRALTGWTDLFARLEEMWEAVIRAVVLVERQPQMMEIPLIVHAAAAA